MCSYEVSIIPLPSLPSASTKPAVHTVPCPPHNRQVVVLNALEAKFFQPLSLLVSTPFIRWLSKNYDSDNQRTVAIVEFH